MTLTTAHGPLGDDPSGWFTAPLPHGVAWIEPFPKRVRALRGSVVVVDSETALLVHRPGSPPSYAFPADHVAGVESSPEPLAEGFVTVDRSSADRWFEEDEETFTYPRNPYHRVDCLRTTRRLRVEAAGTVVVDTTDTIGVYETSLPPRLYAHPDTVRTDLLRRSDTTSYCNYKGFATYWNVVVGHTVIADAAWSYEDPRPESEPIRAMFGFDHTRVAVNAELPLWPAGRDIGASHSQSPPLPRH